MVSLVCLLALLVGLSSPGQMQKESSPAGLKDGDCIVFFGDSITEHGQRPGGYVTFVEQALVQRLPDLSIRVIGAGKGW
ncbi:MAG: GDSL family lipase, partial [Deltaproteobacteria bacterium]|nr:GDSL family lipase [Deltaproteobacteria bacterium]